MLSENVLLLSPQGKLKLIQNLKKIVLHFKVILMLII